MKVPYPQAPQRASAVQSSQSDRAVLSEEVEEWMRARVQSAKARKPESWLKGDVEITRRALCAQHSRLHEDLPSDANMW